MGNPRNFELERKKIVTNESIQSFDDGFIAGRLSVTPPQTSAVIREQHERLLDEIHSLHDLIDDALIRPQPMLIRRSNFVTLPIREEPTTPTPSR